MPNMENTGDSSPLRFSKKCLLCGSVLLCYRALLLQRPLLRSEILPSFSKTRIWGNVGENNNNNINTTNDASIMTITYENASSNSTSIPPLSSTNQTEESIALSPPRDDIADDWGICDPRIVEKSYKPRGKVFLVSFAGWKDKRKQALLRLQDFMHNSRSDAQRFPIQTLLYTEQDLPPEHYQEFAWAYAKDHYRGFWTWKPWILRNLTATGVFAPGDLMWWIDSDEHLRTAIDDNNATSLHPYVYTVLCNMEHRNAQNYGGIYPFERCFKHTEGQYTKPDVFVKMGLDPLLYNKGEQIYAGSFGIKVSQNNDTLDFLQEWTDYGHDPVMYGDDKDFPSSIKPPKHYRSHKNDQSIFSLMVRNLNMTTWPPPYYWSGDSGVSECLLRYKRGGYCFAFKKDGTNFDKACRPINEWFKELPPPFTVS